MVPWPLAVAALPALFAASAAAVLVANWALKQVLIGEYRAGGGAVGGGELF